MCVGRSLFEGEGEREEEEVSPAVRRNLNHCPPFSNAERFDNICVGTMLHSCRLARGRSALGGGGPSLGFNN